MAYTEIHAITSTLHKALAYAINDKVTVSEEKLLHKDDIHDSLNYIQNDKVNDNEVYKTISTALNCTVDNAERVFNRLRQLNYDNHKRKQVSKNGNEVVAWHCIQTFKEKCDPQIANEIGRKLAEELFSNFPCVISTHTNTDHTHNHIIFGAWGFDGKKYHNCNSAYQKIRTVSDRLCKEYGLSIIEHTQDVKLIKWKDEKGQTHFFEPTERKLNMEGRNYVNANDYRNSQQFLIKENAKLTHKETVIRDIERFIMSVSSYDELLDKLRSIGYTIHDKKVNGEWLKYVSYKAPNFNKFVRDSSLSDDGYYSREILTQRILDILANGRSNTHYEYGVTDIDNLDDNRRMDGTGNTVVRSEIEKIVIIDTKALNNEVNQLYKKALYSKGNNVEPEYNYLNKSKKKQYLIKCINANLRALEFIENNNLKSYEQILSITKELYAKRDSIVSDLKYIKTLIEKANENVGLITKRDKLQKALEVNTDQAEADKIRKLLSDIDELLYQKNLSTPDIRNEYILKVQKYKENFLSLTKMLEQCNAKLKSFDNCMYTLQRIDRQYGNENEQAIRDYYDQKEKERERQQDQIRNKERTI